MDLLDCILGHDEWATTQLLELSRDLPDAQLDQPFDIGHQTLRATYDHMFFNIAIWTGLMTEEPADIQRDDLSMAALIERSERFHATFASSARRARDEQRLDDTFIDHYAIRQSVGSTIIQVTLHNAQHRSEARHILERLEVPDLWDYDPQEWEHVTQGR